MDSHRRQFLRLCGVAGIGALAGCSDDSGDSATPTRGDTTATATTTQTESGTARREITQEAKLAADDGDSEDEFGFSVAIADDGTTALVGATNDEGTDSYSAGAAYVFDGTGDSWTQQAKLTDDTVDDFENFGLSVALSSDGTTACIGADDSVYLFDSDGESWSQQARLTADDGEISDAFGRSVALSNDGTTALIGADNDENANGSGAGSAYIFANSGGSWSQQAKLVPDDGDSGDEFGRSVALSSDGTIACVGANYDADPNGKEGGSAYIFDGAGDSWTQRAKLAADDGDDLDQFGRSVALSNDGTTALIGAEYDEDPNGVLTGSAYVFDSTGGSWTQQAKLAAENGDGPSYFGNSVALSSDGTTALVGSYSDEEPNGLAAGSAYVFDGTGGSWTQQAKIAAADGDSEDYFGWSVAVSGDGTTACIGAEDDEDPNGEEAGSAYVFSL